jgi:hypothetical protein
MWPLIPGIVHIPQVHFFVLGVFMFLRLRGMPFNPNNNNNIIISDINLLKNNKLCVKVILLLNM